MKFNAYQHKYSSIRNVVYAKNGAVATSTPLASQAGLEILKKGGNAVDAAVATAATLAVVEPTSNGIGGDAYALVWIEEEKRLYGLNSSGFAPENMELKNYNNMKEMPKYGFGSVTVPGIPAAWSELNKKYGKLSLMECLSPAINYAREGYVVSPNVAKVWKKSYELYEKELIGEEFKPWFDTFSKDGKAPEAGDIFICEEQASTLEEIANTQAESFYRGRLADKIDEYSKKFNGAIRKSDLECFYPTWVEPISTEYKGYKIFEIPPNGHGITVLMALNILKELELEGNIENVEDQEVKDPIIPELFDISTLPSIPKNPYGDDLFKGLFTEKEFSEEEVVIDSDSEEEEGTNGEGHIPPWMKNRNVDGIEADINQVEESSDKFRDKVKKARKRANKTFDRNKEIQEITKSWKGLDEFDSSSLEGDIWSITQERIKNFKDSAKNIWEGRISYLLNVDIPEQKALLKIKTQELIAFKNRIMEKRVFNKKNIEEIDNDVEEVVKPVSLHVTSYKPRKNK